MQPRTRAEMDEILRVLVRDNLDLLEQSGLRQTDLAKLLGTSRLTVGKWFQHMKEDGDWTTLPVGGSTSATVFMNLMITRRLMEVGLADGTLPVDTSAAAKRWVKTHMADPTR